MRTGNFWKLLVGIIWLNCSLLPTALAYNQGSAADYSLLLQQEYSEPSTITMAADILIARPLLLASTVIGTALFIVSSPFSYLGGNLHQASEMLVELPAKNTFERCLGCVSLSN